MTRIMLKKEDSDIGIDITHTPIDLLVCKIRTPDFKIEVMEL